MAIRHYPAMLSELLKFDFRDSHSSLQNAHRTEFDAPASALSVVRRNENPDKKYLRRWLIENLPCIEMDENWTVEEENSVAEFRKLMKDEVPLDIYEDKHVFYKFLKGNPTIIIHS
ncbi:hypothetical protein TNCV_2191421 [Trichonephila clavipes]|nr:hypothetical protein TNCV_2191421 [Trichonephila clavipes]